MLNEGLTLPVDNQVVFGRSVGKFLPRGESKNIIMCLDGKSYKAKITYVNFAAKFNRKKDTLQIRYSPNGELSNVLKSYFIKSLQYIRILEATFNYDMVDEKSTMFETERIIKLRKLNKKIGDNFWRFELVKWK